MSHEFVNTAAPDGLELFRLQEPLNQIKISYYMFILYRHDQL